MTSTIDFDRSSIEQSPDTRHDAPAPAEIYRGEFEGKLGLEQLHEGGYNLAIHAADNIAAMEVHIHNRAHSDIITEKYALQEVAPEDASGRVFGGYLSSLEPGDVYSVAVTYQSGHRIERLLDPYARAMFEQPEPSIVNDRQQSAIYSVATEHRSETSRPPKPNIDPKDRVVYEVHIKNDTMLNPAIPEELRGTYAGFAHPANIARLKELGVTSVEFLPLQKYTTQEYSQYHGRRSHWGYDPVGFFAPHDTYAASEKPEAAVKEFQQMVDALHAAGMEVLMDVVYNHTAEGSTDGWSDHQKRFVEYPVYSFKALDNAAYYRTNPHGHYIDTTGCGNSLNMSHPVTSKLVEDSLRYWVEEMGVDGFRFDLAATLTRNERGEQDTSNSPFLNIINSYTEDRDGNPIHYTAEPWDLGPDGYPQGQFRGMHEWQGGFRDDVRRFWGPGGTAIGQLATRLAGSFSPESSTNFITAHDGFTLSDLAAYTQKRNHANGEDNRDGSDNNHSFNHGVEGPTTDRAIQQQRQQTMRNLYSTNLLAIGTPMVTAGDEVGNTQYGNNNPYAQDNEISYIHRDKLSANDKRMLNFVTELIKIRKETSFGDPNVTLGSLERKWNAATYTDARGIDWLQANGRRMDIAAWHANSPVLGVHLSEMAGETPSDGILYYVNGGETDEIIELPKQSDTEHGGASTGGNYMLVAETANGMADSENGLGLAPDSFILPAKSLVVLRRVSMDMAPTRSVEADSSLQHIAKTIGGLAVPKTIQPYYSARTKLLRQPVDDSTTTLSYEPRFAV